jgi:hypothetical protein
MIPKKRLISLYLVALAISIQANPNQDPPIKKNDFSNLPPLNDVGFITLDQIRFPDNLDGIESPTLLKGFSTHPDVTGYPTVDLDGYWQTEDDLVPIDQTDSGFLIEWEDNSKIQGAWLEIERKWIVKNLYTMNTMEHSQWIKTPATPSSLVASRD